MKSGRGNDLASITWSKIYPVWRKSLSTARVLFVLAAFACHSDAFAQDLEPRIEYIGGFVAFPASPPHHADLTAAATSWQTWIRSVSDITTQNGSQQVTFGPLRCDPDYGKINGKCEYNIFDYTITSYDTNHVKIGAVTQKHPVDAIYFCPTGYQMSEVINERMTCEPILAEQSCECEDQNRPSILHYWEWVGNPISPSTGVKLQSELDYEGSGSNGLKFVRTYRSDQHGWTHNYLSFGVNLAKLPQNYMASEQACIPEAGLGNTPYCYQYATSGQLNDFMVRRGSGRVIRFGTDVNWMPAKNINDRLTPIQSGGITVGWQVYNSSSDSVEQYNMLGRLASSRDRAGRLTTYRYSDASTPLTVAPAAGLLLSVTDQFGHQLSFTYNAKSKMQQMIDPDGKIYQYAYDEATSINQTPATQFGNLTSVTYPDGKVRRYWYNEQDKTSQTDLPFALTGISDENGARFATYTYDSYGFAIGSEHAGGVNRYTINRDIDLLSSVVTDPLGSSRTMNFQKSLGQTLPLNGTQPSTTGGTDPSSSVAYDNNNNLATYSDFNGVVTTYTYDLTRNLETSRTEAFGKPEARTFTTTWHPSYRLPAQIAGPKQLTSFKYDLKGNLLTKTVQATGDLSGALGLKAVVNGIARTWTYTYNTFGQVLTITGPRTDIVDVTTYTYDTSGNIATITNALKQVTTLSNYDKHGHVGHIVDPNGLITDLTYYPRGWLMDITVTDSPAVEKTHYDYDSVGQRKKVTLPDGTFLSYIYDDAHRLTDISDSLGNNIHYTLDAMGNRTQEQSKDGKGNLTRQISRIFDTLNQLKQITGAVQ